MVPPKQHFRTQRGFIDQLRARQLSGKPVLSKPYFEDFCNDSKIGGGTIQINPGGMPSPPFTVRYNQVAGFNQGKWIAIGDEEGHVSIVDGTLELPEALTPGMPNGRRATAQWVAHHNAIFDLAWFQEDERMLTGSGDQCVHLWDTASARGVGQFRGHNGSVKSVCPHATNRNIFASGARDGAMMVWDIRCPAIMCNRSNTAYQAPVLAVQDAHKEVGAAKGAKGRRRKYGPFETKHTVTSVVFLHSEYLLATAGDRDDVVKFWDMRRITEPSLHLALPKHLPSSDFLLPMEAADCVARTPSQNVGKRQHGVTCLALNHQGTRLLVSCNSATHHMYDALRPDSQPVASFWGHMNGSFYIRACFSPDGGHILSGSSDHKAYIWAVDEPQRPPVALDGAAGEVTGVAWCATDPGHIATCHDHAAVTVWTLDRSRVKEPPPRREQAVASASYTELQTAAAAAAAAAVQPSVLAGLDYVVIDDVIMENAVMGEAAAEEEAAADERPQPGLPGENINNIREPDRISERYSAGDVVAPDQAPDGDASADGLGGGRERVPLSAMFGGSQERQAAAEQALGDNQASRHSFAGVSWRQPSPEAPQASSQENHVPVQDSHHREAGPVHPWAARVAAAAAGGRAPLGELRGGFREASQVSRERQETDPIDFSLLQDLEHSRGLGDLSQHFEATQQCPLHEWRPAAARFGDPGAARGDDAHCRGGDGDEIDERSPPRGAPPPVLARVGGRAPALTPPQQLLQNASALCREQLSAQPLPPAPERAASCIPYGQAPERASGGGISADASGELACSEQLPSASCQPSAASEPAQAPPQRASAEAAENADLAAGNCETALLQRGVTLMPPDEATMASAVSVWKGQKKPLCDFLLSQYRSQPGPKSEEGGTPPSRRAGPLLEDGFTDESPAPFVPPQPLTPHPQKAMQDELAQAGKRKAGSASGAKQRSILDFFKTPPSAQGPKRRKENCDA